MNTNTQNFMNLVNGPSKMDLIAAFAYAYNKRNKFTVLFTSEDGEGIEAKIVSLQHEDSSGDSFNAEAYVLGRTGTPDMAEKMQCVILPGANKVYHIYWNTAKRQGSIDLEVASYIPQVKPSSRTHIGGRR